MSVIETRIEKLRSVVHRLQQLLAHPEPGLMTWLQAVADERRELNAIMDGERD